MSDDRLYEVDGLENVEVVVYLYFSYSIYLSIYLYIYLSIYLVPRWVMTVSMKVMGWNMLRWWSTYISPYLSIYLSIYLVPKWVMTISMKEMDWHMLRWWSIYISPYLSFYLSIYLSILYLGEWWPSLWRWWAGKCWGGGSIALYSSKRSGPLKHNLVYR